MAEMTDYATRADVQALDQKMDAHVRALDHKIDGVLRALDVTRETLEAQIRAEGVRRERTDSKLDAVIELLGTVASKTDLKELDERLSERVSRLESIAWDNSRALNKQGEDIHKNSEDIRLLRNEVAQLRISFDRRDLRGDELERRIAEIEKRMGIRR